MYAEFYLVKSPKKQDCAGDISTVSGVQIPPPNWNKPQPNIFLVKIIFRFLKIFYRPKEPKLQHIIKKENGIVGRR